MSEAAIAALAARHRLRWAEALPWLAAIAAYFAFPGYLALGAQVLASILYGLSVDLALGYGGIVTLGQAAFFGAGAYTAGLLAAHGAGAPIPGLLAAGAVAAALGAVSGLFVLRVRGLAQLMATLMVAVMLQSAAGKASSLTGGADGLQNMVVGKVLGLFDFDLYGRTAYWYSLGVLFVCFLLMRALVHSPFGRSLVGMRENEARMAALGAPVFRRRLAAYAIGAGLAGIAGALYAETTGLVAPDSLGFDRSGGILVMLLLGGVGRLYGAFIGVPLFMVAQDRFSDLDPAYWYFWIGLLLVLMVRFARGGILGLVARLRGGE
ncbi:MAG: branched-chain amino acid ABC transporter permease [Rhodospirillales bacterium]|nr:branched-chain amino acid ABC transporter permease [Rhodospirillales bacterium]